MNIINNSFLSSLFNVFEEISIKILPIYKCNKKTVSKKSDGSIITKADKISESIIIDFLKKTKYPIISEETIPSFKNEPKYFWLVDPLDGTIDFVQGTGQFSCMIGLVQNGHPIFGIIYQPTLDKIYFATKGLGTFLRQSNNKQKKMFVSRKNKTRLMTMIVSKNHFQKTDKMIADSLKIKKLVNSGSVGVKVGLITEKKADIYINTSNKTFLWDTCAADIIISEAGGLMTDIKGNMIEYKSNSLKNLNGVVASNGQKHSIITETIQNILVEGGLII